MGMSQSPICSHKYLNHSLFSQVALDDSLQNNYNCVTIEASYTLSDPTSLDRWLNALNCQFNGIRADEKDNFQHFAFDKGYKHHEENFSSLLIPIKYSWKRDGLLGKGGILKVFN